MINHDPLRAAIEIREQLASEKRKLGFFFGAGTSMAVGIPGIDELTKEILEKVGNPYKLQIENIKKELHSNTNIESILNRIRTISELIGDNENKEYDGLKGRASAKSLDIKICETIKEIVSEISECKINPHLIFAHWLQSTYCNRYKPIEIFTTNYDLLFEKSMEEVGLPYFDGFVGSVFPFFAPESVESEVGEINESVCPPKTWTRLWKIHGSINWCICEISKFHRITRLYEGGKKGNKELIIFPSREKYAESRKLPFISFQDRFRKFLTSGETLLIVNGYSFLDEHINEIIFQGLRSNPRLAVTALIYGEKNQKTLEYEIPEKIIEYGIKYKNLSFYGPNKSCIGGVIAPWGEPSRKKEESDIWDFWNREKKSFTLGDFNCFMLYIEKFIGFKQSSNLLEGKASLNVKEQAVGEKNKHEK